VAGCAPRVTHPRRRHGSGTGLAPADPGCHALAVTGRSLVPLPVTGG